MADIDMYELKSEHGIYSREELFERLDRDAKAISLLLAALKWSKLQERFARGISASVAEVEVNVDMARIRSELKLSSFLPIHAEPIV